MLRGHTERIRTASALLLILLSLGVIASCASQAVAPGPPYQTVIEPIEVLGPTGNRIYGQIRRPDPALYPDMAFPAIILVPGGTNPGRMEVHGADARALSEEVMVVVSFNAEGRIGTLAPDDLRSEGVEDFNGFRHQDGLANLITYVAGLGYVDVDNIGLKSQSYGITKAAGCVGRHPDLPIKYLIDGEGPPFGFVTCHGPRFLAGDMQKYNTVEGIFGRLATWQDNSQTNLDWWYEREALNFIGQFRGSYLRLQATWDHAQPPENASEIAIFHHPGGWPGGGPAWYHNKHTDDIVNAAVGGGVPWVRVNLPPQGNTVNATYDADNPPTYLPGRLADQPWAVRAILEMAGLPRRPRRISARADRVASPAENHAIACPWGRQWQIPLHDSIVSVPARASRSQHVLLL